MRFRLPRRDRDEHAGHAQRFVAELRAQPVVAARGGIALVENEIDDLEHRSEPLREFLAARRLVGEPGFRQRALGAHDALGDGRLRREEGARDLVGGQAADHPQRQRRAGLARQARMAGGEDQPQQFVADVVVERGVEIGHRLLLLREIERNHAVLARQHPATAQMIQRPAFGRCHQPGAGLFRHAGRRPVLQRRQQGFLRQVLRQRHVAQHPRQAGDEPRLLDPPDREDGPMGTIDAGGRHGRRLDFFGPGIRRERVRRPGRPGIPCPRARPSRGPRRCLPSPACAAGAAA